MAISLAYFVSHYDSIPHHHYKKKGNLFLKKFFGGHKSFSWGHWYPCFWTSGDECPGSQCQGRSLACFLTCVILRFTSGVTPADCMGSAWQPSLFNPHACRCTLKHWWRFGARTGDRSCRMQQAQGIFMEPTVSVFSFWSETTGYLRELQLRAEFHKLHYNKTKVLTKVSRSKIHL